MTQESFEGMADPEPNRSTCRGCGKEIIWAMTAEGKRIPLDPRPPVYALVQVDGAGIAHVSRASATYVTHFATCPAVAEFSASRRNGGRHGVQKG